MSKLIGAYYETKAIAYLQAKGWHLVQKNYACRYGEIDLIMNNLAGLSFIEVRYRKQQTYGRAEETVISSKKKRCILTIFNYLQFHSIQDIQLQFDILSINHKSIELFQNACELNLDAMIDEQSLMLI